MSFPLRTWRPWAALALLGALCRPAAGSVLVALDTPQLVARAERIVVGTVLDQQSHWVGSSTIVTDVRIRVSTAMLGAKEGDVITVRRLGGAVGEIGMRVFGEASYSNGEEVLLFAERRGDAYFSVGMTQGTLHVATEGGRRMAHATMAGAELVGRAQPRPAVRPLDEVLQEVRSAIQARPALQKAQPKQPTEVK